MKFPSRFLAGLVAFIPVMATAIVDTNNNGVSDLWEKTYNSGELFPVFDPLADPDADGWTNAQEAAAGTNPFDSTPPAGIVRPDITTTAATYLTNENGDLVIDSPAAVTITWPTIIGKQYTLLFSPDLLAASWTPVGPPRTGDGLVLGSGISITQPDGSTPPAMFWRVAISDIDTDGDGLTDAEEYEIGSNPALADSDGDGLSDKQEVLIGTDPQNQDSDGDDIPDGIDSQPLVSFQSFPDGDGDGIADADDGAPGNPRGAPPSFSSETASGNPSSDLIENETVRFLLAVSNPAGPLPTASDLTFFLNGTAETASITTIGDVPPSTRRFLLTWTAKTTTSYPNQTLQNLTLRFRDAQKATTWLNLARIDVAQWQGPIGIAELNVPITAWPGRIDSHSGGVKVSYHFDHLTNNTWYRGPKAISMHNESSNSSNPLPQIEEGMRYPLFLVDKQETGTPLVTKILDVSPSQPYAAAGELVFNESTSNVRLTYSPGGEMTVVPGQLEYLAMAEQTTPEATGSRYYFYVSGADGETPFYDRWIPSHTATSAFRTFNIR